MLGYYNFSVLLTYIGLSTGVVGLVFALQHNPRMALVCLMICGLCDMFDGTIARKCKRTEEEKSFGIQIDSLCDLICFGILPAVIGYGVGVPSWFGTFCMVFYILAAIIRLGYFNVQEALRVQNEGGKRKYYEGLPVTSSALLVPMLILADLVTKFSMLRFYNIGLLVIGFAFLGKFKIKKPYIAGMVVFAVLGAVIFALVWKFGGNIICLSDSIGAVSEGLC